MEGQGNAYNNSVINPDEQRQYESFHEWLGQGSPSSLIRQMAQSGIGSENHRRAFIELMDQVDAELTARGIGFQRTNPENNGQVRNGTLMVQQGNVSSALTNNIDLNANDPLQASLTLNLIKPSGPEAPGANSANPILISSETHILEEDGDGRRRQGASSSNGRRPPFKRRAPEGAPRQLLLGENSGSVQQLEDFAANGNARTAALNNQANYVNHFGQLDLEAGAAYSAMHKPQNVAGGITVLEAGIAGAPAVVTHHHTGAASVMMNRASIQAREAEIFQRNIRQRRNPNLQDFSPASQLTQTPINSHVQSSSQTAMFIPYDHFANLRVQSVPLTPACQYMQVQEPFQTQQVQVPSQRITMSVARGAPAHTPLQQGNLGNNPRNVIFPTGFELENLSPMAKNMNLTNGNTNFPGNATSSQDPSNSNSRISAIPIWYPDQAIRYSNRMLEVLRREENHGLQGDYLPAHTGSAAAAGDMENFVRGGNMRPRMRPPMSRLIPRAERQDADYPGHIPRRRHYTISEAQNALTLVRRGGGLRFEDLMVINRSVLIGMPEEEGDDDVHEDMRLDIDDMSYEELIALGNEIGNVSTGLTEEAILANLGVQKYESFRVRYPDGDAPRCCICQEEYTDGEHMGKLDCGHEFHANCIKLWLMQKNQCPICKKTGLAAKRESTKA